MKRRMKKQRLEKTLAWNQPIKFVDWVEVKDATLIKPHPQQLTMTRRCSVKPASTGSERVTCGADLPILFFKAHSTPTLLPEKCQI